MAGYISIAIMLVILTITFDKATSFEFGDFVSDNMMSERGVDRFCDYTICNAKASMKALNARCNKKCQQHNDINGGYARKDGHCVKKQCCCSEKRLRAKDIDLGKGIQGSKGGNNRRRKNGGNNQQRQQPGNSRGGPPRNGQGGPPRNGQGGPGFSNMAQQQQYGGGLMGGGGGSGDFGRPPPPSRQQSTGGNGRGVLDDDGQMNGPYDDDDDHFEDDFDGEGPPDEHQAFNGLPGGSGGGGGGVKIGTAGLKIQTGGNPSMQSQVQPPQSGKSSLPPSPTWW